MKCRICNILLSYSGRIIMGHIAYFNLTLCNISKHTLDWFVRHTTTSVDLANTVPVNIFTCMCC